MGVGFTKIDSSTFSLQLIKRIGSWPLISDEMSGSWDEGNWSLEANVAKASLLAGGSLFNFGITPDLLNSSIYRLNVRYGVTV